MRDIVSSLGFFQAFDADVATAAAAGETIDLRGYNVAVITANVHGLASAGSMAATAWKFVLQHGLASDAGVSAWSNVAASLMLHSVYGLNGATSTASDGVWEYLDSATESGTFFVGYRGDTEHRYLRLYLSASGAASTMGFGAQAVLGLKHQWPVNDVK